MSQLKHVQAALGWSLVGLLLTYLLINLIGFVSPFWGLWVHPGDRFASFKLLHFWQPFTPWFSILFAVAAWHLAMTRKSLVARVAIVALGVLVSVAHIVAGFAQRVLEQAETPIPPQWAAISHAMAEMFIGLAALTFVALVWSAVRQSNRHLARASVLNGIAEGELAVAEGRVVAQADAKDRLTNDRTIR